jgi:hypothetical protein
MHFKENRAMNTREKIDPVQDIKETQKEISDWTIYINEVIGVAAFGFSVGSLGTPNPSFTAIACFLFLGVFYFYGQQGKVKKLKALRSNKSRTEYEDHLLKDYDQHLSSNLRFIVCIVGIACLLAVAGWEWVFQAHPQIIELMLGKNA